MTNKEDTMNRKLKKFSMPPIFHPIGLCLRLALNAASLYKAEIIILHVFDRPTIGYAPMLDVYIDGEQRQSLFQ